MSLACLENVSLQDPFQSTAVSSCLLAAFQPEKMAKNLVPDSEVVLECTAVGSDPLDANIDGSGKVPGVNIDNKR